MISDVRFQISDGTVFGGVSAAGFNLQSKICNLKSFVDGPRMERMKLADVSAIRYLFHRRDRKGHREKKEISRFSLRALRSLR